MVRTFRLKLQITILILLQLVFLTACGDGSDPFYTIEEYNNSQKSGVEDADITDSTHSNEIQKTNKQCSPHDETALEDFVSASNRFGMELYQMYSRYDSNNLLLGADRFCLIMEAIWRLLMTKKKELPS